MFLGMIFENENTNEGMQAVINEIHSYVPRIETEKHAMVAEQGVVGDVPQVATEKYVRFAGQGVVGDQLSVERGVNSLMQIANGLTADDRKDGIHFEVADFHSQMKFLQVKNAQDSLCACLIQS